MFAAENLKIRINLVIFHYFIIILVTSRKRFIVVKMTFNLKLTDGTWFTYDTHIMHVNWNNICMFVYLLLLFLFPFTIIHIIFYNEQITLRIIFYHSKFKKLNT